MIFNKIEACRTFCNSELFFNYFILFFWQFKNIECDIFKSSSTKKCKINFFATNITLFRMDNGFQRWNRSQRLGRHAKCLKLFSIFLKIEADDFHTSTRPLIKILSRNDVIIVRLWKPPTFIKYHRVPFVLSRLQIFNPSFIFPATGGQRGKNERTKKGLTRRNYSRA